VVDCGLWIVDCGLWIVDCGCGIADAGLWMLGCTRTCVGVHVRVCLEAGPCQLLRWSDLDIVDGPLDLYARVLLKVAKSGGLVQVLLPLRFLPSVCSVVPLKVF
jgi:hypothetical protein